MPETEVEVQAIACLTCGVADLVRQDDPRATRWPAWEPGPHEGFCPKCGGDCWAAEPIPESTFQRRKAATAIG